MAGTVLTEQETAVLIRWDRTMATLVEAVLAKAGESDLIAIEGVQIVVLDRIAQAMREALT
jgi:hypothetical protein